MEVYFDNAATSYPKPETVYQAMDAFMREVGGSPGRSTHRRGREASRLVSETRTALARLFNIARPEQIVFTANATEALNLALKGLLRDNAHVITTSMEHNSVIRPLARLRERGIQVTIVPCDVTGLIDPEQVHQSIRTNTMLIAVNHASNVTGTLQPLDVIGSIAREHGIPFLVDAAQTSGTVPIDVERQQIDLLAFSGHKGLFGPQGTGGLYIRPGIDLMPLKEGGTGRKSEEETQPDLMPDKYESGTLNTVGIVGLRCGAHFVNQIGVTHIQQHEQTLTRYLIEGLSAIEGVTLYGPPKAEQRTAVVSFNVRGQSPTEVGFLLDAAYGIMARAGLHCAPLAHKTIGSFARGGTVRLSLSYFNTRDEVNYVLDSIAQIAYQAKTL
jgi:cysteine desulfurase family protein